MADEIFFLSEKVTKKLGIRLGTACTVLEHDVWTDRMLVRPCGGRRYWVDAAEVQAGRGQIN